MYNTVLKNEDCEETSNI